MTQFKWFAMAVLAASLGTLGGCATSVSRISDDGKSDSIVFPDKGKDAWVKEGTFPNLADLRSVAPGMSKDQLYALFGPPHFKEGMFGVREWDYIFNFRESQGYAADTCQYKVIFTPDYHVRSVHWLPQSCVDRLIPPAPPAPTKVIERIVEKQMPAPVPPVLEPKRVRLGTDGLFTYKKSALADLLPDGVRKLDELVDNLLGTGEIDRLTVVGHTDRIGSDGYNLKLSQARADTVREYLVAKGIQADRITATGVGEAVPLVQCEETKRAALIKCLQPNRRVEIEAWSLRKQQ